MMPIRDFFTKLFKKTDKDKPWLEYYSREEKSIKFRWITYIWYLYSNDKDR